MSGIIARGSAAFVILIALAAAAGAGAVSPCAGATVASRQDAGAQAPGAERATACVLGTEPEDVVTKKPGEARRSKLPPAATAAIERAKHFKVVYKRPENPSGETIVLLHGSGGNETTLIPLASRVAPHATLMGVAGRVTQEGTKRWFQRISPTSFDQTDIRAEADAFVGFLNDAVKARKLDLDRTVFIGYSNGANLLAAVSLLHPGLVERAILLRPMPILDVVPTADLTKSRFLTVVGETDEIYAPFGPRLETILREHGARVDARMIKSGHLLGDDDVKVVAEWLDAANAVSRN